MSDSGRGPGVPVPPPVLFIAAYVLAWILDRHVMHAWPSLDANTARGLTLIGWAVVLGGLALAIWGRMTFLRRGTTVMLIRDASVLVTEGPYRFSRNPMYTGIIVACIGGAAILKSLWPLATVALAAITLYRWVIRSEERYLTAEFGDQYREYQRHVGRWFTF